MSKFTVRHAGEKDVPQVLRLMQALADFEGYRDRFAVEPADLSQIIRSRSDIGILVAASGNSILGMLVYFYQPFTYDLKPWMIIKELYVDSSARTEGLGQALFLKARDICRLNGGTKIKWEVLTHNHKALDFYSRLGAERESDWQIMSCPVTHD